MYRFTAVLIVITSLSAFPPDSYKVFKNNLHRLLKNNQYTFTAEYFLKYGERFQRRVDIYTLALNITKQLLHIEQKTNLLFRSLKWRGSRRKKSRAALKFAQLLIFLKEYQRARHILTKSYAREAVYYRGVLSYRLRDYSKAMRVFRKYLDFKHPDPLLRQKTLLYMARIVFHFGDYKESYRLLLLSDYQCVERIILLYKIYTRSGELQKRARVLDLLENKYRHLPQAKQFLKKNKR